MEKISISKLIPEFETLLGNYLWNDLNPRQKKRLILILDASAACRKIFQETTGFDENFRILIDGRDSVTPSPLEMAQENVKDRKDLISKKSNIIPFQKKKTKKTFFYISLAAASLLFVFGSLHYRFDFFQNPHAADRITYTFGSCFSPAGQLHPGGDIGGKTIRSGTNSLCDLEFNGEEKMLVRMFAGSKIYTKRKKESLDLHFIRGAIMIEAKRLGQSENIRVISGGRVIHFMGTKIYLRRNAALPLKMEILKGKVKLSESNLNFVAAAKPELSDTELQSIAAEHPDFFKPKDTIFESGETITIYENREIERKRKHLISLLTDELYKSEEKKNMMVEVKKWSAGLSENERKLLIKSDFNYQTGRISKKRLKKLDRSFSDFSIQSDAMPAGSEVDQKLPAEKKRKKIKALVKEMNDDSSYTIFLKSGRVIKGEVYQDGDRFIIITGSSRLSLPRHSIRRIENN